MQPHLMQSPALHPGLSEPGWLADLFVCPDCRQSSLVRQPGAHRCRDCQAEFPIKNGIHYLFASSWRESFHKHKIAWSRFGAVLGTKPPSEDDALRLPESPLTRDLLAWLRTWLAVRGPSRILELGAGRGWASRALAENGHEVVALDAQDDADVGLGFAARWRNSRGPWFGCVATPAEALPFRDECFDCVFCFATLRHILDLEGLLCEVKRVLKPGGMFLAFEEPFRGALSTPIQRLQNSTCYKLARWWQPDEMSGVKVRPEITRFRETFGLMLYEAARRTSFYLTAGEETRLQTNLLPVSALLTIPPDSHAPAQQILERRGWLDALADAYCLDQLHLRAFIDHVHESQRRDLLASLLAHWVYLGNVEGVLLAQKTGGSSSPSRSQIDRCRRLDNVLLSCSQKGFVPVHGFHRVQADEQGTYHWMQPFAALLIRGAESIEVTIAVPPRSLWTERVRIDLHLEDERTPLFIFLALPGKTVTFKVPIPRPLSQQSSILLRLTSRIAFMPSDHPHLAGDTRLLAIQLRSVRTSNRQAHAA